jgi:hypothetical protein
MFIKRKDKIDLKKHVAGLEYRLCRVEKEFRQLKCEHKEVDYIFDETWGPDDIYYKKRIEEVNNNYKIEPCFYFGKGDSSKKIVETLL